MSTHEEKPVDGDGDGDEADRSPVSSDEEPPEYVYVDIEEIRRDIQCPICLGIIRKTKTMMECLHRFCTECIEKAIRIGKKECPTCRRHCASRRAFRDDPNFDAIISILIPDLDKFEAEEITFQEEEMAHNKQIQDSISVTYKRQTKSLRKKRLSAGDSSSQRNKKWSGACSSMQISTVLTSVGTTEIVEAERETMGVVALPVSPIESVELPEIRIMLLSIEEQRIPNLEQPDIFCKSNLLVRQLSEYVAQETEVEAHEVEIYLVKELQSQIRGAVSVDFAFANPSLIDLSKDKMQVLEEQSTLSDIIANYCISDDKLVLAYDKREMYCSES